MSPLLDPKSNSVLAGVHPDLIRCVEMSWALSTQPFIVFEGLRSAEAEARCVSAGNSWTTCSKHLKQSDGFGHAVDLVPLHSGAPVWDWDLIYPLASAMAQASFHLSVPLRWGGVWDSVLETLGVTPEGMKRAVASYEARHPGPDHIDGPHFELGR